MAELSPATAAVLRAAGDSEPGIYATIAATLRAAADQVMPRTSEPKGAKPTAAWHRWNVTAALRLNLLAIAAELETQ